MQEAERLPASFLQEELFTSVDDRRSDFSIPVVWRLQGPLRRAVLGEAVTALVERHEALRTTLGQDGDRVHQLVRPPSPVRVEDIAIPRVAARRGSALHRHLVRAADRPFDLDGGPLMQATLLALGPGDHVLVLNLHHAISDAWSTRVLLRDFRSLYAAALASRSPSLRPLPLQFADYAAWERAFRQPMLESFWRAAAPRARSRLDLPVRAAWRPDDGFDTAPLAIPRVPAPDMRRLVANGEQHGAGLGTVLRALVAGALMRHAEDQLTVGVLYANRDRHQLQPLVGFVSDFLPVTIDVSARPSFAELLVRAREAWRSAYDHRMPFGHIRRLWPREGADHPFDVTLNFTPYSSDPVRRAGRGDEALSVVELIGRYMRGVRLDREITPARRLAYVLSTDARGALQGWIAPNNAAFSRPIVAALARQLSGLARWAARHPDRPIADAPEW